MKNTREKRNLILKIFVIFFVLISLFLSVRVYIDNNTFGITKYTFMINDSKYDSLNGKKIIQISDLHNQQYGKDNCKLINAINDYEPNYILLTGDMVNAEDTTFEGFFSLIDGISDKYICIYAIGNHEQGLSNSSLKEIYDYLISKGVYVLDNDIVAIEGINFVGLNYDSKYYIKQMYSREQMMIDIRLC